MTPDYLRTGENWGSVRRYLRSARARARFISLSRRTRATNALSSHANRAMSWRCLKSAGSITPTCAARSSAVVRRLSG